MSHLLSTLSVSGAVMLFCTGALLLGGCRSVLCPDDAARDLYLPGNGRPWTTKAFRSDPEDFQFAIVSDRTGGLRPGVFASAVGKLNLLQPEFVMSVGDLIEGYTDDKAEIGRQRNEFDEIVERLEMPFFYVAGNHDIQEPATKETWLERFGRNYYHFVYRDVLFVCLDTEELRHQDGWQEQVDYVSQTLAENPSPRWTLLFFHWPLWDYDETFPAWERTQELLGDRPHTIFAGHRHWYVKSVRGGNSYIRLATTGGSSDLMGPYFGRLDHVVWVTMTDEGPRIANLALDGIHDENLVTEEIADQIDWFRGERWMATPAVMVDQALFTEGSSAIRLVNTQPAPLKVRAVAAPYPRLTISPRVIDRVLPPGSEETITLEVKADAPMHLEDTKPLTFEWTASCDRPDGRPLSLARSRKVFFDQTRTCPRLARSPKVDGRLDDWAGDFVECKKPAMIRGAREEWTGPEDCRWRFALGYDDDYLYVAVESFDDVPFLGPDKERWRQDAIRVYLDARDDPERSESTGRWNNRFEEYFLLEISCGQGPDNPDILEPELFPEGTKAVCAPTATGLVAELAIPVDYLNERQGKPWEAVRVNTAVRDHDGPADAGARLWWRPRWDRASTYFGSGTFVRR